VLPNQPARLLLPRAIVPRHVDSRRIAPERHIRRIVGSSSFVVEHELIEARTAWRIYQSTRERDAVYAYLGAVFKIVSKWRKEQQAKAKSHQALRATGRRSPIRNLEPFTAVIFCTSDPRTVDGKTRSKWSRALRYVEQSIPEAENLPKFMKGLGGINECADRFSNCAK
jgi:hypothetical protein